MEGIATAMEITLLIPLIACISYCALLPLAWKSPRPKLSKLFIHYLFLMIIWSLSSLFLRTNFPPGPGFWSKIMLMGIIGVPFVFFHFTQELLGRKNYLLVRLGYLLAVVFAVLNLLGLIVTNIAFTESGFHYTIGPAAPLLGIFGAGYTFASGLLLCIQCIKDRHSFWSNRLCYLSVGAMFVVVGSLLNFIPEIGRYPVDITANTINAFLLAYAIYRHRLLSATIPIRKALVLFLTFTGLVVLFLPIFSLLGSFDSPFILAFVFASLTIFFYEQLKGGIQTLLDRVIFGEKYNYRETLKAFSKLMTSIIDLSRLADSTLELLVQALHVKGVLLFLPNEAGDFSAHAQKGYPQDVLAFQLDKQSAIVRYLARQSEQVLTGRDLETKPEFRGLWQQEKEMLEKLGAEVIVGLNIQGTLQGILFLAGKTSNSPYTDDDLALLITLTNQAAVALHNAQTYHAAWEQAIRDDLTKLYNFRYFHEYLDKEISRCAEAKGIFSLILLDLDFFKTYNDVYGHLAGDKALIKVAQAMQESIRPSDVAARYGGDEFVVILPETGLEQAKAVAERIRENVCLKFQNYGCSLLTVSLGVAAYPEHGRTKQQLLTSVDRALYRSKNLGRNLVTETALEIGMAELAAQAEKDFLKEQMRGMQLDTIYTLAAAIYARDNYTYEHSKKVTQYAVAMAEELGLSDEHKQLINNAAMLHDIGKIGIPESVLNKPGPLTSSERELIQYHVTIGETILNQMPYLRSLATIVRHHHERYDGYGYPDGLSKENIPLEARILAIADAFHAMTSDRPYRKALTREEAIEEMIRYAGTQFDPHLVPLFVNIVQSRPPGGWE